MTDKAALHKLTRARAALVVTQPFWGVLALGLKVVEREDIDTMATDGESIFYLPSFVKSLSDPELRGVIAHEVEHVARLHHTRRGNRNSSVWNEAADHTINLGLIEGKFKLPAGGLMDAQFKGMSAETIYPKLMKKEEEEKRQQEAAQKAGQGAPGAGQSQGQPQPGQGQPTPGAGNPAGQPGQQPGAPGSGQPQPAKSKGGFGQVMDAPGGEAGKAAAEAKTQANVRQAASVAKAHAGKLPGNIEEIIKELDKPRVDWRAVLRRFADESTMRETCWTKPSRRPHADGFIMPGQESVAPSHLVAIVDTSGSIGRKELQAMGPELQAMLDERATERISVVYCDTRVQRVDAYASGDVITMRGDGGGGTYFAPAFAWVDKEAPDASAIVYMTDLYAGDWSTLIEPSAPVLWARTGSYGYQPAFGEVVPIDVDA